MCHFWLMMKLKLDHQQKRALLKKENLNPIICLKSIRGHILKNKI